MPNHEPGESMVQRSVKSPLMIAVPVLLVMAVVAVYFLLPEPPAPPPSPPPAPLENTPATPQPDDGEDPLKTQLDPRPRPRPNNGAPNSAAVATAMLDEAWGTMESVRSRLELKYKYAEYKLDRSLTLETLMRRLSRMDGEYFKGSDYNLNFPAREGDFARIECATIDGRDLPDGSLVMSVNLRTGETKAEGTIFARNRDGYVLLGDSEYRELSSVFREAVLDHYNEQQGSIETDMRLDSLLPADPPEPFVSEDFRAVSSGSMGYKLACVTINGEALATPVNVTVDYESNTISSSNCESKDWLSPPDSRERLKDRLENVLRDVARSALRQLEEGKSSTELRMYRLNGYYWYFRWAGISPFDVSLDVAESESRTVTLTIATSYGKTLPFESVRYVAKAGDKAGAYID